MSTPVRFCKRLLIDHLSMNYLAHGYRFTEDPLFLAGTAVPDWLRVAAPRIRVRPGRAAASIVQREDESCLCRGIMQHHADDDAFHAGIVFQQLCEDLAQRFRRMMPDPHDHRPGLLGHIIIEMLLDNELARRDPGMLPRYYQSLKSVDPVWVQAVVNSIVRRPVDRLAEFIELFREIKFLYDYAENDRLIMRLNQVLSRARLKALDSTVFPVLNHARHLLEQGSDALMQSCEYSVTPADEPRGGSAVRLPD